MNIHDLTSTSDPRWTLFDPRVKRVWVPVWLFRLSKRLRWQPLRMLVGRPMTEDEWQRL